MKKHTNILIQIFILRICDVASEASGNDKVAKIEETYALQGCERTPILRLCELWQHFALVYPQNMENSTALLNLNKRDLDSKGSCRNKTEFTLKQLCRLDGKFGPGYFFNRTTKEMTENPRARFYWEKNFQGSFEDFSVYKQEGMCQNLEKLQDNVRSVETFGSCIRLFYSLNCKGPTLAVYPGRNNSHDVLNTHFKKVKSVGPCLNDEFFHASFEDPTKRTIVKTPKFNKYNPDVVEFYSVIQSFYRISHDDNKTDYFLGLGNALKFLRFDFDSDKITNNNSDAPNTEMRDFYKLLEKEDGDEMTFAIPLAIGGPNQNFNIFPASKDCVEKWNGIILNITLLSNNGTIAMNFVYDSYNGTRPVFFYYHIEYRRNGSYHYLYGRILNGNGVKILSFLPPDFVQLKPITKTLRNPLERIDQYFKNLTNDTSENHSNFSSISYFNQREKHLPTEIDCHTIESPNEIQEIPDITDGSYVPQDYIEDMVGGHKFKFALFFTGKNYTGCMTKYFTPSNPVVLGCYNLTDETRVESVQTFGKCIRLYEDKYCLDKSLAVYPGSENSQDVLQSGLSSVRSVAECFSEGFSNSTFSDARRRRISKNPDSIDYIPDLSE